MTATSKPAAAHTPPMPLHHSEHYKPDGGENPLASVAAERDALRAEIKALREALSGCYENMRITADLTNRKWTQRDQSTFEKAEVALKDAQ